MAGSSRLASVKRRVIVTAMALALNHADQHGRVGNLGHLHVTRTSLAP